MTYFYLCSLNKIIYNFGPISVVFRVQPVVRAGDLRERGGPVGAGVAGRLPAGRPTRTTHRHPPPHGMTEFPDTVPLTKLSFSLLTVRPKSN